LDKRSVKSLILEVLEINVTIENALIERTVGFTEVGKWVPEDGGVVFTQVKYLKEKPGLRKPLRCRFLGSRSQGTSSGWKTTEGISFPVK